MGPRVNNKTNDPDFPILAVAEAGAYPMQLISEVVQELKRQEKTLLNFDVRRAELLTGGRAHATIPYMKTQFANALRRRITTSGMRSCGRRQP